MAFRHLIHLMNFDEGAAVAECLLQYFKFFSGDFWCFWPVIYIVERMWAVCLDLRRAYWYLRRFWISGLSLARPPRVGSLRGIFKKTWFRMHWGVAAWEIKQSGDGDYESKNRTPSMSPCTLFFCFLVWKKHSCIEEQVGEWCFLASAESKQDCISWRFFFGRGRFNNVSGELLWGLLRIVHSRKLP